MNNNQVAVITKNVTANDGRLDVGLLAVLLGKRKDNVIRKIENTFPKDALLKMRDDKHSQQPNGGFKRDKTLLLDKYQAVAVAAMYDPMISIGLLQALESALSGLNAVTNAATLGEAKAAAEVAMNNIKSYQGCGHLSSDERHTALKNLR
ncbi:hypothetical protein HX773_25090 [Pantoea sp. B9002]|uniref:hypothetical protein n=1 Tax=Pantoea sp. B9002 TaxID=2726979 RepID=UPI0015A150F8|nr:hypothetical protein [Pantoea sp. B9002]NWA64168.1 hypothetical protein [Pantoea sp. B9002]